MAATQLIHRDGTVEAWEKGGIVHVGAAIRDEYPPRLKEALIRRRTVSLAGYCPCGIIVNVRSIYGNRDGQVLHAAIEHEDDCPAPDADDLLEKFMGVNQ